MESKIDYEKYAAGEFKILSNEYQNLLYRVTMLEADKKTLLDMNKELAWEIHDRDKIIEELRNLVKSQKEILVNQGYFDDVTLN